MKKEAPVSMLLFLFKKKKKLQKTSFIPEISFSLSPKFGWFNLSKLQEVDLSFFHNISFWKECMYLPMEMSCI